MAASALATAFTTPESGVAGPPVRRLTTSLEQATGLHIDRIVLEGTAPRALTAATAGASLLFTASDRPGAPRDVWRAKVRVTPDGRLLSLDGPVNLTQSAIGDDGPLVVEPGGARVAFVTRAFGQVQSAAILDVSAPSQRTVSLRHGVTNSLATLSWHGVDRWDLRLDQPVRDLSLAFDRASLVARGGGRAWRVDVSHTAVSPERGASLVPQREAEKALVHWAVDTVRGLSWVGPVPIAWLEETVFGVRDAARRYAFRWFGRRPAGAAPAQGSGEVEEPVAAGRELVTARRDGDPHWPPADITPPLTRSLGRERGEGVWADATPAWLRRHAGAPPAFYRTTLRLDPERPYTRVVLLAMDLRQLRLSMQAGVEDPVPLVGPRGDGRIPRDPAVLENLVGAFNGAFKTEHGEYGMVVDRRVLLPPRPRAATVATLDDGRVAMGSWDSVRTLPPSVVSLRQNLDPLTADGVENPTRRAQWGFVLGGIETMPTTRSGLCIDPHGAALYVWGDETTGRLLARAMRLAGCSYGMHLDMNPGHAVFHFLRVDDLAARQRQHQPLVSDMHSGGERFVFYSPKDFFYLTLRPLRPRGLEGSAWTPLATQPAPHWMPALFERHEGALTVTSLSLDRVSLRLRAGRREPIARAVLDRVDTLTPPDGVEVLGAIELGVARSALEPRGLALDGRALMPFSARHGAARFELTEAGPAIVTTPSGGVTHDAIEGRLLVEHGAAVDAPTSTQSTRLALGITRDGRLLVARGVCDLVELARAMVSAGAETALSLDATEGGEDHWGNGVRDAWLQSALFVLGASAPSPVTRLEPILAAAHPTTVAPAPAAR